MVQGRSGRSARFCRAGAGRGAPADAGPGFYRMMLGDFEVTALLDGTHAFPAYQTLQRAKPGGGPGLLADANPDETDVLLAAVDLRAPLEGSINAFLINTGAQLVLMDSGAGMRAERGSFRRTRACSMHWRTQPRKFGHCDRTIAAQAYPEPVSTCRLIDRSAFFDVGDGRTETATGRTEPV